MIDEETIPPPAPPTGTPYYCPNSSCGRVIGHVIVRNGSSLLVLPGGPAAWRLSAYCACGKPFWFGSKSPAVTKVTKRKR